MYKKIEKVEFELTSICNAYCPGCARYIVKDDGMYLNPRIDFNKQLDISIIEKVLESGILSDTAEFQLCGTVGDPLAHTKFYEILQLVKNKMPGIFFNIHTNGGLKNPNYYRKISQVLTTKDVFKFSVDGIEESNHIYRKNVEWHKIVENAKALHENKICKTVWLYIEFPWNKAHVETARIMAKELGFDEFIVRRPRNNDEFNNRMIKQSRNIPKQYYMDPVYNENTVPTPLKGYKDLCFSKLAIFIDENGIVHPCCDWASRYRDKGTITDEINDFYGQEDWNNLYKNDLANIMTNSFWSDLYNSLYTSNGKTACGACNQRCGINDYGVHWDNYLQKTKL